MVAWVAMTWSVYFILACKISVCPSHARHVLFTQPLLQPQQLLLLVLEALFRVSLLYDGLLFSMWSPYLNHLTSYVSWKYLQKDLFTV